MAITLNDFTSLARQTAASNHDATTFLRVRGDELSETGRLGNLFTTQATRRETIDAFMDALRAEYGDHVADMINRDFGDAMRNGSRPLTARAVLDLTSEARNRIVRHNQEAMTDFLNGQGEDNLDTAIDRVCDFHSISSDEDKALLRNHALRRLTGKAGENSFFPKIITDRILYLITVDDCRNLPLGDFRDPESTSPAHPPSALKEKLRLLDMGLNTESLSLQRALSELETMRGIQPEGNLSPENVYKTLFKEDPAPGLGDEKILKAIETRCKRDRDEMRRSVGAEKSDALFDWAARMPWKRLASLAERPDTVTLADVAIDAARVLKRNMVRGNLEIRTAAFGLPDLSAPTFSFKLREGENGTEIVRLSDQFETPPDEDDRDVSPSPYVEEGIDQENALTKRLDELAVNICGGRDASGFQVARVKFCLTGQALEPLANAAVFAGVDDSWDFVSHVSVNFSRSPDGSILAEFSSPEEARDALGHFSMSLSIARDGETTMTGLEIVPPKDIRERREAEAKNAGEIAARRAGRDEADAFCKLDDSADGLFARIKEQAGILVPGVEIRQSAWEPFARDLAGRLEAATAESPLPLTPDQRLDLRQKGVDEFFDRLKEAMDAVPPEYRERLARFCLEAGDAPDASALSGIRSMINTVNNAFGAILKARDEGEARGRLDALGSFLRQADSVLRRNPGLKARNSVLLVQELSMRLGVLDLMGGDDPKAFAKALTRPGPFRDMLHALARTPDNEAGLAARATANTAMRLLRNGLVNILPDDVLKELDGDNIRERDLSLPRQRAILGKGKYAARGAEVPMPELAGLNQSMARDMPAIIKRIRADAETDLRSGPFTGHTELGLSKIFEEDYSRHGVFVDGRYYHPAEPGKGGTGTSARDFKRLFPDDRTARLLSNLAAQNLSGCLSGAIMKVGSRKTQDGFINSQNSAAMANQGKRPSGQNVRIDTLDAGRGRYRITSFYSAPADNPEAPLDRFMHEVTVDVNLSANRKPSVERAHVDILIRGREVVPGEE